MSLAPRCRAYGGHPMVKGPLECERTEGHEGVHCDEGFTWKPGEERGWRPAHRKPSRLKSRTADALSVAVVTLALLAFAWGMVVGMGSGFASIAGTALPQPLTIVTLTVIVLVLAVPLYLRRRNP